MIKAVTLSAVLATALGFGSAAQAASVVDLDQSAGEIIQVYGGCGVYGHRGPYGGCRTGGQFGGYIRGRSCPAGFHVGRFGQHCLVNRF